MQTDALGEQAIRSLRESAELCSRMIESADVIARAAQVIYESFQRGGKVLLFGNGGSAADAQHIAAEFVCRFKRERNSLPAIALTTDTSVLTAIANDYGFEQIFARQIQGLCRPEDVALAISTSGSSPNVLAGVAAAREKRATTIGLTGGKNGALSSMVDISIVVPSDNTARIQECHITIAHILCEAVDSLV